MNKPKIKITKKPVYDEYIVRERGGVIGQLYPGDIIQGRVVLAPEECTEWTSECLRTVADKLDEIEKANKKTTQ